MVTRMTEPQKRNRHPDYRTAYRVDNWREYEQSLRARGDIRLWISQGAIDAWTPPQTGKRGAQPVYSELAIETAIALRLLFHLPLRQTEGFLGSVLRLMGLSLPCHDHTTLSRRNATVTIRRHLDGAPQESVLVIVDSTGLKVCGQGEWHAHKHGERVRNWIEDKKSGWYAVLEDSQMPAMSTALDQAHNAIDRKLFNMKGFHHASGSQAAFLTGLAHLYNLIPYQRRAKNTGLCGCKSKAVMCRLRTGC